MINPIKLSLPTPGKHIEERGIKVKVTLEQPMKAQRGSRGIAVTLPSTLALGGGGWPVPCPDHFTPRNDPVPIV